MGNLFQELRRRNVFRVSTAYLVLGWLIIEVTDTVFPQFEFPLWTNQFVTLLVILGFPIAVFFAWAFEITPDGIKRESDVNREDSITTHTGRKLNFLIISILVIALGYFVYESRYAEDSVIDDLQIAEAVTDKSIAVLPFIDLSPDRSEAWFSDGLTAEILNNLTQLPELMVSARTSSFQFRGENRSIPEIAMRLGVTYVVEGSVRRLGDQLRITAQLIRADDGFN
ncbi:MAG: adenylyl cyclase, partial [Gammaproteobacteria bacterium]|nr:adenylyl cyclase [Gammaproteobacteria bacterium]